MGSYHSRQSQSGVALLTILLLVVAITIVAGSMLASQRVMLRQYELTQNQGKFREYALAGEVYATQLIEQDSKANQTDSVQDSWAKPIPDYPLAEAKVHIEIQDEASRFNINNLYHDGKVDTQALNYFKALLTHNGIEPNLALAVLDWQDPDNETSADGGAEADYYQSTGKKLPMSIANQPFISVQELRYVRGMDDEKFAVLRPLITAVPFYLPMNVNTVQPELLAILPIVAITSSQNSSSVSNSSQAGNNSAPPPASATTNANASMDIPPQNNIDSNALNTWANLRKTAMPIDSVDKLWAEPIFANINSSQQQALSPLLAVQSYAFRTLITVNADNKKSYMTSQLAKVPSDLINNSTVAQPAMQSNFQSTGVQTATVSVVAFNRQFLPIAPNFD